jgi:hypothetical protein
MLETDASGAAGLGAVLLLSQEQPDGATRPIAYASRMTPTPSAQLWDLRVGGCVGC